MVDWPELLKPGITAARVIRIELERNGPFIWAGIEPDLAAAIDVLRDGARAEALAYNSERARAKYAEIVAKHEADMRDMHVALNAHQRRIAELESAPSHAPLIAKLRAMEAVKRGLYDGHEAQTLREAIEIIEGRR